MSLATLSNCVREAPLILRSNLRGKYLGGVGHCFGPTTSLLEQNCGFNARPVWNQCGTTSLTAGTTNVVTAARFVGCILGIMQRTFSCLCRYLGGWPASPNMLPEGAPAILDCTCELPRVQRHLPYDNLPIWDTHGECSLHCGTVVCLTTPSSL